MSGDENSTLYCEINKTKLFNNSANRGGAIGLGGITIFKINKCEIDNNHSVNEGGGISSWGTDSIFIDNTTFNENVSLNGNWNSGGALRYGGDVGNNYYCKITNSNFTNNSSKRAGAILAFNGSTLDIIESNFNNNQAIGGNAGAILINKYGKLNILKSEFVNNSGRYGGAILYDGSSLSISNSSFKYNSSNGSSAGAINAGKTDNSVVGNILINDSEFIGNYNESHTGALRITSSDTTIIKHTVIDSNETERYAGGSNISNTKYLEIDSSTITNNMANGDAAGLAFSRIDEGLIKNSIFANNIMKDADADTSFGAGLTLWGHANIKSINNTFVGNKAYKASAIGVRDSSNLELVNTIIWDNPGTTQLGLYIDGTLTAKNSVIGDGKASIDMDDMSKITSYDDQTMIETNPLLCDYWSGSWPQLAGNYHLTYLSPAIGKGENGVNMGAFDVGCDIDTALLSVDELIDVTPTEYALHDNYPNPFNPTTTLRFDLPEVSSITLTIYNMLGQRVRTFNMNDTPAGYHSIKWNATNDYGDPVGAGVYLYQLQANQYVKTRKMVLLK